MSYKKLPKRAASNMYITLQLIYHLQQYDKVNALNDELDRILPLPHLFRLGIQDRLSIVLKLIV